MKLIHVSIADFFFWICRTRREKISSKILIYCCVSLLLLHFSFLLFTFFRNILPCWFLNFILHYGGSSSLLWIAADGINMWRKLFVDVFDKRKHVFFHWSKIFSWGKFKEWITINQLFETLFQPYCFPTRKKLSRYFFLKDDTYFI